MAVNLKVLMNIYLGRVKSCTHTWKLADQGRLYCLAMKVWKRMLHGLEQFGVPGVEQFVLVAGDSESRSQSASSTLLFHVFFSFC